MRFRGKLVDIGCIQHLTRVVATIAKLAKVCVCKITSDRLFFILSDAVTGGGAGVWCELQQDHFFSEYAMDGLTEDANEIFLEVSPDNIVRCLKSAQNAKSVKIKLTKKHTPCLTFEVDLPSATSHSRLVVHDVPVTVIPRRMWDDFNEPEMPEFDVSLYMPPLKTVKNVVDKMKNLSNYVVLSANRNGEMNLCIETDLATVTTHFKGLQEPHWTNEENPNREERDPSEFADARIDIRKLAQLLLGQQVNPVKVICNLVHDKIAHLYLLQEDVSLQYFIPVVDT